MNSPLRDKTALVTGASSGIGAAIARALAAEGVHLGISGRNEDRLKAVGDVAAQRGVDVWRYTTDFGVEEELRWLAGTAEEDLGGIDILIHSAGTLAYGSMANAAPAVFESMWRINVLAPSMLTQMLLPALRDSAGDVVFINSRAGMTVAPMLGNYSATKFALRALADALRAEAGNDGIRVLSVYPGPIATPMQQQLRAASGQPYDPENLPGPEEVARVVVDALKMPDTTELTDITMGPLRNPGARKDRE